MNELVWHYDEITEYWAKRVTIPISSKRPQPQYDGLDYRMWETTWRKHILTDRFPEYCHYPHHQGSLLCSPSNIIRCLTDQKVLEALALIVAWGRMTRTKNNIYKKPLQAIEESLLKCMQSTEERKGVDEAWRLLVNQLEWGNVIASKCLHFLTRSLGYETNPPVPIDNKVIIKEVWPTFKKQIKSEFSLGIDVMPQGWWEYLSTFKSYNRYMTAINIWADLKGWTTTQLENTIYKEFQSK
jgi:hypothetical protein